MHWTVNSSFRVLMGHLNTFTCTWLKVRKEEKDQQIQIQVLDKRTTYISF